MAEDDLDYHVCFPSPDPPSGDELYNDFATVQDDTRNPVIILLGWTGCDDNQLWKYSSIYEKKGYITIRYTTPTNDVLSTPAQLRKKAIKVLELLFDLNLEDNPLFFHVFSNGGGQLYHCIVELLLTRKENRMLQVHGTIFDSCPSKNQLRVAGDVLMHGYDAGFCRVLASFVISLFLSCWFVFHYVWCLFSKNKTWNIQLWDSIRDHHSRWPQLFLYSKKDKLVKYSDIDELVKCRTSLGVDVSATCWEDSAHVQHLQAHVESYTQQCLSFVDDCTPKY